MYCEHWPGGNGKLRKSGERVNARTVMSSSLRISGTVTVRYYAPNLNAERPARLIVKDFGL